MAAKPIFRVTYQAQGKVYEIFARAVRSSDLYGFLEVEKLIFGEKTTVVLDPSEEQLKTEFKGVSRTHLPIHSVIRIDEVDRSGPARISPASGDSGNVTALPIYSHRDKPK